MDLPKLYCYRIHLIIKYKPDFSIVLFMVWEQVQEEEGLHYLSIVQEE